jgi:serine protease Do
VGFAIPINQARNAMERLATDGKITRGYLGVYPQPVTPDLAREFKLPDNSGALVGGVQPNTPAAVAGIRDGDVIIELDGKKVTDPRHLRLTFQTPPKTKVSVKSCARGRKRFSVTGTLPDEPGGNSGKDSPRPDSKWNSSKGSKWWT